MTINGFNGEYRFLSNFYPARIYLADNHEYPTVEHAYQATKTNDADEREKIRLAAAPGIAKMYGRYVTLRPDWDEIKVQIMHALVWQKFSRHESLREKLLATGDHGLVEANNWGDTFWGVCNGQGANHLGLILENVRSELRKSTS